MRHVEPHPMGPAPYAEGGTLVYKTSEPGLWTMDWTMGWDFLYEMATICFATWLERDL